MVETGDSLRMQGKRKRKRKRLAIAKRNRVDRISGLPEEVLLHILSFITTRQAVQMSLLSKRWRHLWTSIPALFFEEIEFSDDEVIKDYVEKVLICRREDKDIRKVHFLFKTRIRIGTDCVGDWIIHATRGRNIQELVIESRPWHYGEFKLPGCLFSCGSLRVLKLDANCGTLKLPDEYRLSELKSLHLHGIFSEETSLQRFISNCPFLEDLHLESCCFESISISGEQLKKLSIIDKHMSIIDKHIRDRGDIKIRISAPNLRSFKYSQGGSKAVPLRI